MKNGYYLTLEDFPEFQNEFSKLLPNKGVIPVQSITFVVTENCNLACTYCYETHKTNRVMSRETAKKAIDAILDDNWANGYYTREIKPAVILDFIGGEPFLNIDVIDYATEYFKYKANELGHPWAENYMISISTNGTLYFDKRVQDYIARNAPRLSLGITIDGNKALHDSCRVFPDGRGSYNIVEAAVLDYLKYNPSNKTTKITLSPQNVEFLFDAVTNVFNLGIEGALTNCCFEPGWTLEHAKVLYKEMIKLADWLLEDKRYTRFYCSLFEESIGQALTETKNWCGGNGHMLAIGTDGICYPCIRFMDYSLNNRPGTPIGSIESGLENPCKNCYLCKLREIDMLSQCQFEDNRKCLDCPIASGCALCTGFNYDYYGDPNHKATFICEMHKARVLANAYFWNKLYREIGISKRFTLNLDLDNALKIITHDEYDYLKELGGE